MTDEHLMRQWTATHSEFTGDLDRGLLRLGRFVSNRLHASGANSTAYAPTTCKAVSAPEENPVARAALAGALACLATTVLLLATAIMTTAGTHAATSLAVVNHVIVA